jgi:hypothetical protein
MDIEVVGDRKAIAEVPQGWGFRPEEGRDHRLHRVRKDLGNVDLVGPNDRSGLPPRSHTTPYGEVLHAPIEYLIVRRLVRLGREHSTALFRQAEVLAASTRTAWIGSRSNRSRSTRESYPSTTRLGSKFTRADQDEVGELLNPPFGRSSARAHTAKG